MITLTEATTITDKYARGDAAETLTAAQLFELVDDALMQFRTGSALDHRRVSIADLLHNCTGGSASADRGRAFLVDAIAR